MRNRVAFIFIVGMLAVTAVNCVNPADTDSKPCSEIALDAQSAPKDVYPDSTYTFNTNNTSGRRFLVILARKDAAGKLHGVKCVVAKRNECTPLVWKSTQKETLYITYKFHNFFGTAYKTIASVHEGFVDDCAKSKGSGDPVGVKSLTTRKGIIGDTGGSGSASTTVDDK